MRKLLFTIAAAGGLAGCNDPGGPCTASVEPGIVVVVEDAVTSEPVASEARGVVQQGAYVDSLRPYGFDPPSRVISRAAADERAGVYTVRVEHPGYQPFERAGVVVSADECHVRTVRLRAALVPLEPRPQSAAGAD